MLFQYILLIPVSVISFLIIFNSFLFSKDNFYLLGSKKCSENCHDNNSIGNQYKIWISSPHARAARDLKTEKALEIGARVYVAHPSEDYACLKCHTTGKGKIAELIDEGVGCEACHGPGSVYLTAGNHVNYLDRKGAYLKAVQNGMYPILDIVEGHLKKREKLCRSCHTIDRPCLPEDVEGRQKQITTIQVIDKLVKGDIDIRHPLRR